MLRTFCHAGWDWHANRKPSHENSRGAIPAVLRLPMAATSFTHSKEMKQ